MKWKKLTALAMASMMIATIGVLISNGQSVLDLYPYQIFYPALVLCIIVLAFNLLGDGLRDALDPRLRQ